MKVKVLGLNFEVKEVETVNPREIMLGQIDFLDQSIRIQKDLSSERKQEVLIHECLHGIAEATGYDEELDEKAIQALGRGIYSLFKENPTIFSLTVFEKEQNPQQS